MMRRFLVLMGLMLASSAHAQPGAIGGGASAVGPSLTTDVADRLLSMRSTGHWEKMQAVKYFACDPAATPGCDAARVHDLPNGSDANACTIAAPCATLAKAYTECPPDGTTACLFGGGDEFAYQAVTDRIVADADCNDLGTPCLVYSTYPEGSRAFFRPTGTLTGSGVAFWHISSATGNNSGTLTGALFVIENITFRDLAVGTRPALIMDDGGTLIAHRVNSTIDASALGTSASLETVRLSQDSEGLIVGGVIHTSASPCVKLERGPKLTAIGTRCVQHGNSSGNYGSVGGFEVNAFPLLGPMDAPIAPGVPTLLAVRASISGAAPTATARGMGVQLSHSPSVTGFDTGRPSATLIESSITGYRSSATNGKGCIVFTQADVDSPNAEIRFLSSRCSDSDIGLAVWSSVFAQPTAGMVVNIRNSIFDLNTGPLIHQTSLGGTNGWIAPGTRWIGLGSVIREDAGTATMFELRVAAESGAKLYDDVPAMRAGFAGFVNASAATKLAAAALFADHTQFGGTTEPTDAQLVGPRATCDPAQACAGLGGARYSGTLPAPIPPIPGANTTTLTTYDWVVEE